MQGGHWWAINRASFNERTCCDIGAARPLGVFWAGLLCAAVAGCVSAPGMKLDVRAAPDAAAGDEAADIRRRAEIYRIDIPTLARLRQAGASDGVAAPRPAEFQSAAERYVYLVGAQDVLRITVFDHPELTNPSGTANELSGRVVNADGSFFFPYIGAVRAAGRTVQEIQATLVEGLAKVIRNPQIDVAVLQFRSQRVVVAGEVRNPGAVAINDVPPTLAEVLAQAGGASAEADLGGVKVTRGAVSARVDLYAYYYNGDTAQNLRLQAGDVINVPDRRLNKVFVLGEVSRPNSLVMPRGRLTLAEALADVGGINPLTANAGQVYVLRDGQTKPQIYHLDAAAPDALLLADRFDLRSRDVVFVDAAPIVRWGRIAANVLPSLDFLREALNDTTRALPR